MKNVRGQNRVKGTEWWNVSVPQTSAGNNALYIHMGNQDLVTTGHKRGEHHPAPPSCTTPHRTLLSGQHWEEGPQHGTAPLMPLMPQPARPLPPIVSPTVPRPESPLALQSLNYQHAPPQGP